MIMEDYAKMPRVRPVRVARTSHVRRNKRSPWWTPIKAAALLYLLIAAGYVITYQGVCQS